MNVLGEVCMFRLFASPLVIVGLGMSRLFARYPRPKRLTMYSLLIEGLTLAALLALLILPTPFRRG
jgi:predicted Co/Zn/Cd cation transporter (cation efflux family)